MITDSEDYDLDALKGAAEFFENMATGADTAPLAFAQAIRHALPVLEMMAEMDDEGEAPSDMDTSVVADGAWKRFVESMPAARVINDNQPDNQAVIVVLRDPPTLPVGTLLYTSYQGMKDNAVALEVLEQADLLDALKAMVAFADEPDPDSKSARYGLLAGAFTKARAAIAKAEGRP